MEYKNDEKMVYLKDLLFVVLYRWKTVLIVALALALVLGGYKTASRMGAGSTEVTEAQIQQYEMEKAAKEQLLLHAQNTVRSHQAYMDGSMLMQLDPYGYYEAVLSIYVKANQQDSGTQTADTEDSILGAYQAVLQEDATLQEAAKLLSIDSRYVAELINVTVDPVSNTMEMRVKCTDAEAASNLATLLATQADLAQDKVQAAVARHSLQVLKQDVTGRVDPLLVEQQQAETKRLQDLKTALADAKTAYAAVQMPDGKGVSFGSALKSGLLFAVLGAVAGAFVTVCALWVGHITTDKIYSARTLRNRTGIKILGCLPKETEKCKVDRFLRKAEGRCVAPWEEQLELVAADIRCRAQGVKHLLLAGNAGEDLAEALEKALPGVKISTGDILRSADAVEALKACDAVVLTARCGSAGYSVMDRNAELTEDYGKQLLGCVLIGG